MKKIIIVILIIISLIGLYYIGHHDQTSLSMPGNEKPYPTGTTLIFAVVGAIGLAAVISIIISEITPKDK